MTRLLVVALLIAGCASWEETRVEVVFPINDLLHHDYPRALRALDEESVRALYHPDAADAARRDLVRLTRRFLAVDRASCAILTLSEADADGRRRAECLLRMDGVDHALARVTLEQRRHIVCQPAERGWTIRSVRTRRWRESCDAGTEFADETAARGIDFTPRSRGVPDRDGRLQTYLGGCGLAVADIDRDGWEDLLLLGGDALRLYRNHEGRFVDETKARGPATPAEGECRCAYFADVDNDGDADLFVGVLHGRDRLYRNENGRFVEATDVRFDATGETSSACFGDFDRDGDLDLVVVGGQTLYSVEPDRPYKARNGTPDRYYRNRGDGTFEEATEEAGLGATGWGLAAAAADYDRDGDLDLVIANDLGPDLLYRNRGDGTFEEVAEAAGLRYAGSSMSAAFGDIDNDGLPDLYISGMASNSRWMTRLDGFPLPAPFPFDLLLSGYIRDVMWQMYHGNRLYRNRGDGTFDEVSQRTGTARMGWGWSAVFGDFDNDADLDIYGANGFWSGNEPDDT